MTKLGHFQDGIFVLTFRYFDINFTREILLHEHQTQPGREPKTNCEARRWRWHGSGMLRYSTTWPARHHRMPMNYSVYEKMSGHLHVI